MSSVLMNVIGALLVVLAGVLIYEGVKPLGCGYFFIGMAMFCFARM